MRVFLLLLFVVCSCYVGVVLNDSGKRGPVLHLCYCTASLFYCCLSLQGVKLDNHKDVNEQENNEYYERRENQKEELLYLCSTNKA